LIPHFPLQGGSPVPRRVGQRCCTAARSVSYKPCPRRTSPRSLANREPPTTNTGSATCV
jgi:hypothetical protein